MAGSLRLLTIGSFVAAAGAAFAQDAPRRDWPSASQRWAPPAHDCTCRAQGRDFQMGETVCLRTIEGARLASCGMVLNNSSWAVSDTPCTVSSAAD